MEFKIIHGLIHYLNVRQTSRVIMLFSGTSLRACRGNEHLELPTSRDLSAIAIFLLNFNDAMSLWEERNHFEDLFAYVGAAASLDDSRSGNDCGRHQLVFRHVSQCQRERGANAGASRRRRFVDVVLGGHG